jgi:acetyl-CoA carboxylase biotin carboxyl carrier protein
MGMIKEETLKRLIEIVEASQIDELEISRWGTRVKITRRRSRESVNGEPDVIPAAASGNHVPAAAVSPAPPPAEVAPEANLPAIKSPMVGTFYSAAAPGQPPFVGVGDGIAVGQVVCIIEAMKLMNEIHSDVAGRVVKILVTNGQPVEYGQTLFLIDPRA